MGPLGKQELVFIFILVLLLFGPLALRSLRSPQSGEHSHGGKASGRGLPRKYQRCRVGA